MKDNVVVLYPSPGIGHLISMVELGKRFLLLENPPFSITVLITHPPFNTGSTDPYIRTVSASHPSISFHHLPPVSLSLDSSPSPNQETLTFRLTLLNNPLLLQSLQTISQTSSIRAIVLDFFCTTALEVANQLKIPPYFFFTSPASMLAYLLYFQTLHRHFSVSFQDLPDTDRLHIPGLPPLPPYATPKPLIDRNDEAYHAFLHSGTHMPKANGIIINTFDTLEPRALMAISDGACVLDGPTPPIHTIGPLIASSDLKDAECLSWLDSQPHGSVVFLCFGSLGLFSGIQLKEIAVGLERSGQRFVWVVRSPPTEDKSQRFLSPPDPDLDTLLPDGFLDRTKERGLVVKSWAPQAAVLNRESVGGFVTHCGWNSVLEAVCAGVPMLAWPLYAEQRLNKVILVEELKLALDVEGADKGVLVSAAEVERGLRRLMESEEGKGLKERAVAMRESAMNALSEGGSSHSKVAELAQLWMRE
ncbi:anthocyanidin 5,3-O-glucosyltransferase-like [Tasmannia lanceolata]|uniref:anthocyanidin 5,3-O-glucosyltransferase-like n=1 Tax=Tasmannia lanceolata TaxID=3420 RepID=UPI004062B9EF